MARVSELQSNASGEDERVGNARRIVRRLALSHTTPCCFQGLDASVEDADWSRSYAGDYAHLKHAK